MLYMYFAPLLLENLPLTPHFAPPLWAIYQFTLLNMYKYLPVTSFCASLLACARGRLPSPAPRYTTVLKRYRQLRVKDLLMVITWRLVWARTCNPPDAWHQTYHSWVDNYNLIRALNQSLNKYHLSKLNVTRQSLLESLISQNIALYTQRRSGYRQCK